MQVLAHYLANPAVEVNFMKALVNTFLMETLLKALRPALAIAAEILCGAAQRLQRNARPGG